MSNKTLKARQELEQIARECGGTPYVNRHYPDKLTMAFGPDAWEAFCKALAEQPAQQKLIELAFSAGLTEGERIAIERPAQRKPLTDEACKWARPDSDHMPDTWQASCGAMWTFTEGGPKDNDMHFCPKCGKPAIEDAIKEQP